jgi:hypothetical protein
VTGYNRVSYDQRTPAIPWRLAPDGDAPDTGNLLVQATIDGRSYCLNLDSAALRTELVTDEHLAALPASGRRSSGGAAGQREHSDIVTIPGLTVGDLRTGPVQVVRADPFPGRLHLLGLDLIGQHCCDFRFTSAELWLSDSPDIRAGLDLTRSGSGHIYLDFAWATASATTVWDSGSSITLVDAVFAAVHPDLFTAAGEATGTDATGATVTTPLVTMDGPVIAGVQFAPSTAAILDLSAMNDGLDLPMSVIAGIPLLGRLAVRPAGPPVRPAATRIVGRGPT